MRGVWSILILLVLLPVTVIAEQRYVTDDLSLDMRREPGNEFRILRMLPAGTPVRVLEAREGWSRVQVDDIEGWVVSRFLSEEPTARDRLADAQAETRRLARENTALRADMDAAREQAEIRQQEYDRQRKAMTELQGKYDALLASAGEPIRLMEENQQLTSRIQALELALEERLAENAMMRRNAQRDWFIAGAAVLGAGLVLGLLLSLMMQRRQRRLRSEWM